MLFVDRLDQSIRRAQRRHPECCAAVLFLDLDRFKVINDSLGHAVGDQLLKKVAQRLEAALRPNDTVARLSGDEFTLLLDDVCEAREATIIAERVLHSLQAPFLLDGRELFIGASIGIALATAKSAPEQVMRDADVAMYRAKADGKGRHAVFDAAMHEQVMRRLDLEGELRSAIETRLAGGRLSADRAGRDRPHRRLRGARPLAARRAGGGTGDGRGDGAGRPARPPGPAGRVRAARGLARAAARRRADRRRQRLRTPAGEPGFIAMLRRTSTRPGWTRGRCGSRSPSTI